MLCYPSPNDAHRNPSKCHIQEFQDNDARIQPQRLDEHNQCDQYPGCRENEKGSTL